MPTLPQFSKEVENLTAELEKECKAHKAAVQHEITLEEDIESRP